MSRIPAYPSRPHSSGQARVKVNGKTIYLGVWGSDESKKKYAELVHQLSLTGSGETFSENLSVSQLAEQWRRHAATFYSQDSREPKCFEAALIVVERIFGTFPAKDIDAKCLKIVRAAMVSGSWMTEVEKLKRRQNGSRHDWSKNYTNAQIARIKSVWRWAEGEGIVPRGSWDHLRSLRGLNRAQARETKPREPVAWETVLKVLPVLPPAVAAMIQFQWWTGCRPGEVVTMLASEIDRSGAVWVYRPEKHKTKWRGQDRAIAIGTEGQKILGPFLDTAPPGGFVFVTGWERNPYTVTSYGRAISRGCERAKSERFTAYCIRHSFKLRVTRAMGLDAARAAMGQTSLGATNSYARQQDMTTAENVAKEAG
jgi:integrase